MRQMGQANFDTIKPIFEKIIKIGKLKEIPGIVLVNIINKKYLF